MRSNDLQQVKEDLAFGFIVQESAISWTNKSTLFSCRYIIIRLRDLLRRYQDELSDWN